MSRQNDFPSPWRELAADAGSVGKLAEALQVSPMTLWRWANGKKEPSLEAKLRLNAYAKGRRIPVPYPAIDQTMGSAVQEGKKLAAAVVPPEPKPPKDKPAPKRRKRAAAEAAE